MGPVSTGSVLMFRSCNSPDDASLRSGASSRRSHNVTMSYSVFEKHVHKTIRSWQATRHPSEPFPTLRAPCSPFSVVQQC